MIEHLIHAIRAKSSLPEEDAEWVRKYFQPVLIPANRTLEDRGQVPRHLYFVVSGYVRLFHFDHKGDEITTHINCPPGFITAYSSFIREEVSQEMVESITACELLRITKTELDELMSKSEAIKDFGISALQESSLYNEKRTLEMATLSAEERYLKLLSGQPNLLHHVPLQYIATFLGMKPESLSRIRRKLNTSGRRHLL